MAELSERRRSDASGGSDVSPGGQRASEPDHQSGQSGCLQGTCLVLVGADRVGGASWFLCVCVLRKSAFWVLHSSSVNILGPRRLTSVLRWRNEFWSLLLTSGLWRRSPFSEELTPRTCRSKVLNQLFFNTLLYFFVCVDFVLPLITLQAPYTHAL